MRSNPVVRHGSFRTADGVSIAFEEMGEGPLVVVCHGGPASGHEYLHPELSTLAAAARVVFWDYRGSGASGTAPSATYTFERLADDLDELRTSLDASEVVVLAHSMGGMVALTYSLRYRDRCAGLILIATAPTADARLLLVPTLRRAGMWRVLVLVGRALRYLALWSWRRPSDERTLAQFSIMATLQEGSGRFRDEVRRREVLAHNDNADRLQREATAFDIVERLAEIACPALVLYGARDAAFAAAAPLYSRLPDAQVVEFDGVGHHVLIEARDDALTAIRAFIARVDSRRFVDAIRRDTAAIIELCGRDPTRPIASCPGWAAGDLQQHIIDTFRGEIPDFGDGELDGAAALARAVALLGDAPGPARDVAQECAVHRWDASVAFGVDYRIDPDLACDGIDDFFAAAWPLLLDHLNRPAGTGETLCLRRSDGPNRWRITLEERPVVHHDDLPGDVEVTGSASDLLLWLWGRSDPPTVSGNIRVLEHIRNPSGRFLSPGF